MSGVRRSIAFSALDSYLALVLQLTSTVIVARILTPEQTGVFAVAAVFASLASTFRDFGVGEFLIQEKELDHPTIQAALSVNIGVSWLMALGLFILAPFAADFYRASGVADVMRVQAVSFLLIPFGAVTMAWFRREMNFKPIFIAGIAANLSSFVTTVTLALRGFGYMSLAWGSLVGVVVTVTASVLLRPKNFPRWPALAGVGRVISFGKFASGIYIFGQLGKGAPEMIIGRAMDMAAVGLFSRAYGLVEIFHRLVLRSVSLVYLPYFANAVRSEGTPRRGFVTAVSFLTALGWPFLAFMGVAAYAAIRLMYGTQWMAAVPLASVLCAAAAVEMVYYPAKESLLSQGLAKEANSLQMIMQALRVLGIAAVVPWGLPGACWGLLASTLLGAAASHVYLARHSALTMADMAGALWPSLKLTLIAVAPVALWRLFTPIDESNYLRIGVGGGLACAVAWFAAMRGLRHPLWPEVVRMLVAARARLPGGQRG